MCIVDFSALPWTYRMSQFYALLLNMSVLIWLIDPQPK